jgi:chromate transporter
LRLVLIGALLWCLPMALLTALFGWDGTFTQMGWFFTKAAVTWFTFLPSFLFILAGGPLVESTHNELKFTAPLTAITAAVVGVILNLACFFAYHVFWPKGFAAQPDFFALLLALAATLGLFVFKRGVIEVLIVCALVGLGFHLLR